tara:strand:- start:31903 stop:32505 length:603 start_codon:yes stop_codon:yes gene_type:complete
MDSLQKIKDFNYEIMFHDKDLLSKISYNIQFSGVLYEIDFDLYFSISIPDDKNMPISIRYSFYTNKENLYDFDLKKLLDYYVFNVLKDDFFFKNKKLKTPSLMTTYNTRISIDYKFEVSFEDMESEFLNDLYLEELFLKFEILRDIKNPETLKVLLEIQEQIRKDINNNKGISFLELIKFYKSDINSIDFAESLLFNFKN